MLPGVRLWVLALALVVSLAADWALVGRPSAAEAGDATGAAAINSTGVSPPTVVLELSLTPAGTANPANELIVSWDGQTLPEGEVITGFDVRYQVWGTIDWTDYPFDGMGLSATITGLASNTAYGVQVRAVNAAGPGPWSMTTGAMTRTAELTVAFAGSNYMVAESETATITVTITPVSDRNVTATVSMTGDGATFADVTGDTLDLAMARGDGSYDFQIVTNADGGGSELTLELATTAVKVSVGTPGSATVTINGHSTNSPPAFDETGPAARSVLENSPADTVVGAPFTATDPDDGDTLAYSLTGDDVEFFDIDSSTGQITVASGVSLDHEAVPGYSITVTVTDGTATAAIAVNITVTDVNESPTFGYDVPNTVEIAENSPASTVVGEAFVAIDADGDQLAYSLTGQGSGKFAVDGSGQITVAADAVLDFEDKASYTLTLGVKDNKDEAGNAAPTEADDDTIIVTIELTDVSPPTVVPDLSLTSSGTTNPANELIVSWDRQVLPEGEVIKGFDVQYKVLGTIDWTAYPFDGMGLSATITGLASNTEYGVQVRVVNGEGPGPWSMTARAMTRTAELAVAFGESNYTVTEGETATITLTVTAVADRDVTLTVSMTGEGGTFDDGTGNALTLDIARGQDSGSFEIVTAADAGGSELTLELATMTVKVSVGTPGTATLTIDQSPNSPPTFDEVGPVERSVSENSPADTLVGRPVTATDPEGNELAYSLHGDDAAYFDIHSSTGQITVTSGVSLDHEAEANYSVTVTVTDGTATATIAVNIMVTDENEAPIFNETGPTERTVPENVSAGANVGAPITATDPEGGSLVYWLIGLGSTKFVVDNSGQITVDADDSLDFENTPSYTLTLGVKDNIDADGNADDTEGYDDTIAVTITVTDVNEAPIFAVTGPAERTVPENSPADTLIGRPVTATDPEGDTLAYSLIGSGSNNFAVDAGGQITVAANTNLDHEGTSNSYSVTVMVTDGMATATIVVNITVTDVNEPPAFGDDVSTTIEIAENTPGGTKVGAPVTATDPDNGDTLAYSLTGADSERFIVAADGQITVAANAVLDFEETPSYTLTLGVKDNKDADSNAAPMEADDDTVTVTISLTDVLPPPAPEGPSFSAGPTDPASERFVRWTALVLPESGAVTDYDVQYLMVGAAQWTDHPFDGTGLSTTITGLTSNTEYEVQVRAANVEGPGPWSISARSMTAKAQLTIAFGESNYTGTEGETTTITVTVTPAADREVTVLITVTEAGELLDVPEDILTLTITRGQDSGSFEIVIGADTGGSELTLELTTTAVKVSVGTPGTATLTIDEPPNGPPAFDETGPAERSVPENSAGGTLVGAPVTGIDPDGDPLTYSLAGPDSDKFVIDSNGQIAVAANVGLDFEAAVNSYTVTAQVTDSHSAAGDVDATIDDTIAVTIKVTDVAGPAPVENGSIVVGATGANSLKVTWAEVFDATSYQVWRLECGPEDPADDSGACTVGPIVESESAVNSHTAAGLKPATRYQFTIRGVNGEGAGDWTNRVSGATLAVAAPIGLEATPLHQSIILIWDDPHDAGIIGYQFRLKSDEESGWSAWLDFCHSDALTTVQVLPGLSNGSEYAIQIRALNARGKGAPSIETQARRPGEAALPARPTGLIATPGDRNITLTWSDANDPSITGYQLRIKRSDDEDWLPWQNITGGGPSTTSHLLPDLANGSEYAVQLRARNGLGESVPSVEALVTPTEAAPPRAPAILATRMGDGSVTITWSDPGDPQITGYQVRRRLVGEGSWRQWKDLPNSGVSTTSHMVRNLTNEQAYALQIRAVSALGEGVPSNQIGVTPSAPVQSPRTIFVEATAIGAVASISDMVTMIY